MEMEREREREREMEMEEELLLVSEGEETKLLTWRTLKEEAKRIGQLAGPMVVVSVSQQLLQIISTMMVGHLGELSLSASSLATSFAGVTGFSFLLGMASGIETLCGQAYGAQQYRKLGNYLYSSVITLIFICIPLSFLWINLGKIFALVGQDPLISHEAGRYAIWLIPALFGYASLQPLVRYLQSQSLTIPMLLSSFLALCIHIPLCWVLIYKSGLGTVGAALAIGISYWLNAIFLIVYIIYSPTCEKTRVPLSKDVLKGIPEFLRVAIPSTIMICLEWWSFELLVLVSGIFPNPQLETSVLSICLQSISFVDTIGYGFAAAASTRVSNELGAGNPLGARLAVCVVMLVTLAESIMLSAALFASRNVLGYAYSNEKEVINYVTDMAPLICCSVILDSLQISLSGVARGSGWQHLGAYVNLASYYIVGVPVAIFLGFYFHLRGKGLWIGIVTGAAVQFSLLALITSTSNWKQQAMKAKERVCKDNPSIENEATDV